MLRFFSSDISFSTHNGEHIFAKKRIAFYYSCINAQISLWKRKYLQFFFVNIIASASSSSSSSSWWLVVAMVVVDTIVILIAANFVYYLPVAGSSFFLRFQFQISFPSRTVNVQRESLQLPLALSTTVDE